MKRSLGLSLIEVTLGLGIMAFIAWIASSQMSLGKKSQKRTVDRLSASAEMVRLATRVLKIGRQARSCSISSADLSCNLDYQSPPTLDTTKDVQMRFLFTAAAEKVELQKKVLSIWSTQETFTNIDSFVVCDDSVMAGTCSIPGNVLSTNHTADLSVAGSSASLANRFYRFQIGASLSATDEKISLQSAFYIRNPAPNTDIVFMAGLGDN